MGGAQRYPSIAPLIPAVADWAKQLVRRSRPLTLTSEHFNVTYALEDVTWLTRYRKFGKMCKLHTLDTCRSSFHLHCRKRSLPQLPLVWAEARSERRT